MKHGFLRASHVRLQRSVSNYFIFARLSPVRNTDNGDLLSFHSIDLHSLRLVRTPPSVLKSSVQQCSLQWASGLRWRRPFQTSNSLSLTPMNCRLSTPILRFDLVNVRGPISGIASGALPIGCLSSNRARQDFRLGWCLPV